MFGHGRPILFLHGWGGDISSFLGLANLLSTDYKCILPDFWGHGKTPPPDSPVDLDNFASETLKILDVLKLQDVSVVGHSFGGRVAIKLASDPRISRIILIDAAGLKPKRRLSYYYNVFTYKLKKKLKLNIQNYGSEDYKNLSPIMRATFIKIVNENLEKHLSKITQPTLIIWGIHDADTPIYMAKKFKRHIRNSGLVTLDGGHFCYLEKQRTVYLIIKSFLDKEVLNGISNMRN